MIRRVLRSVAAAALLLPVVSASATETEPPEGLVRGMLGDIGVAVEACSPEATQAFADREVVCGTYPKGYSQFRLDWDSVLNRYDLRSRVTPASPWVLREGRYNRDYEAGEVKLRVSFDERSGQLLVAFTLPDAGPGEAPPVPGAAGSSASAPHDGVLIAGFGGVTTPVLIPESRVEPVLPEFVRTSGLEGIVTLQVLVRRDGSVAEVQVLRVEPQGWGLGEAATRAVEQWRYEPARRDGEPVDVWFTVLYEFKGD